MIAVVVIAFVAVTFAEQPSHAAEITCLQKFGGDIPAERRARALERWPSGRLPNRDTCTAALIRGPITVGDGATFARLIRTNHPFLERVLLWSSGGSVEEAMKIGRLIRKGLVVAVAPISLGDSAAGDLRGGSPDRLICSGRNCHCASACFLIWASGITRSGISLGLHRPTTRSTGFASLPPDRATVLYRQLLADIAKYLGEMEVPQRFVEIMTDTSSRDIRWLTFDEADSLSEVPSVAEWTAISCSAMSKGDKDAMNLIGARINFPNGNVLQREQLLYEQLQKRSYEIYSCAVDKIDKARDAIKEVVD